MTTKKLLTLLALASLAACSKAPEAVEEVRPVRTMKVMAGAGEQTSTYSGEIRARFESPLGFRIPGQVVARNVQLGQTVRPGQVLMRLDPTDAQLQESAAKSQLEKARLDLERAQSLFNRGFVSQSNVDQARVQFNALQAQHSLARNQAGYSVLTAERAGTVIALNAEVGQVVAAGMPVLKIAEGAEREVVISVPESRVEELRNAKNLQVSLWASPGKRYEAHLRELAGDTDPVTRTYAARIAIVKPDDAIRLGMTANVQLPADAETVMAVPLTAVFNAQGKSQVWVLDGKTMQVAARAVELGGVRNEVVLLKSGVTPGETVVTAGVQLLHAGEKVRVATVLPVGETGK